MYPILGHHHLSMLTKDAKENHKFYQEFLGLRRVKLTVNQDDPSMYHIFYGDKRGSPGTELTFFEMPFIGRTYLGTNAISRIGLLVRSKESLLFWKNRLSEKSLSYDENVPYAGRTALSFHDPDGLNLMLISSNRKQLENWDAWENSSVPIEHQILGIGPVEITVRRPRKLERTLVELFSYTKIAETEDEMIFHPIDGEIFGEIVVREKQGSREKPGRGSVHHLAIRVKNETELKYWAEEIKKRGFQSTGILDRYYFQSLYFRESNGILFELATDGPGFTVDSDVEHLGERLDLPPFLEGRRNEIEEKLGPI